MSPVREAWVPPQSSSEGPMRSMRTTSPYFSSKMPMAPRSFASSIGSSSVVIGVFATTASLTMSSMRAISSAVSGLVAE